MGTPLDNQTKAKIETQISIDTCLAGFLLVSLQSDRTDDDDRAVLYFAQFSSLAGLILLLALVTLMACTKLSSEEFKITRIASTFFMLILVVIPIAIDLRFLFQLVLKQWKK